ncbi:SDR family oxidoreductase [Paenibacillus macerans]|uniref:SDR family oxidoreductase n=1 Tax=Paenibacillus macerans TaxID=44252 RepID=UPI003D31D8CB
MSQLNQESWDLNGKVCLITGANAGIGKRAAKRLAGLGSRVIVVCRNPASGAKAVQEIKRETGNHHVELIQADLSSMKSVRQLAEEVQARYERLDVLIHNAANFDQTLKRPMMTEEGLETIFATNHLGPFLLTHLLIDLLKESAPSRVITIASKGLIVFPRLTIDFENLKGEKSFSVTRAYYQSKLAQLMFTYELAERHKDCGVTANCIRVPSVKIDEGRHQQVPAGMKLAYRIKRHFALNPEDMAKTYAYLAADPSLVRTTGEYFDEHYRIVKSSRKSYDRAVRKKLWSVSEQLTGIDR